MTPAFLYISFLSDLNTLQWNLVYNFGLIYNNFKNVVYFFLYPAKN
jgi:hypothetical protein